ncbi:MAG: glycosyltransferase family 4 protein, partial [Armatimonadetes bacterium]|nr:glycosyltransferase family 4 protein [Armatimonadota bacterium]
AERIQVLPNPVAAEDLQPTRAPDEVRSELGAEINTPIVGTFAHLSEKKGWRELMQAIPHVLEKQPQTQFWCVGDGPMRDELQQRAEAGGFAPNVKFLGFRRDVADVMNAIDVMALPSHREPFGIVYVEAALLNKPVVACNAGGAPDVVADGVTGRLIPSGDAGALAQVLVELLGDRAQSAQMGRAGRERALDLFGWEAFLPRLEAVYQAAMSK